MANMEGGFYLGTHRLPHVRYFDQVCISVNLLRRRHRGFSPNKWMMDSGAFTEISTYGRYRYSVQEYYSQVRSWTSSSLMCAVSQDYMCEPFILAKTGLTVEQHQRLTIERYDLLLALKPLTYILPVLQGYSPREYVAHIRSYADRLRDGAWVGVGSVCKRNSTPRSVLRVLQAIHAERPDLRLHGFGLKLTALQDVRVVRLLHSCDSMAWSFNARRQGQDANGLKEALVYNNRVLDILLSFRETINATLSPPRCNDAPTDYDYTAHTSTTEDARR
jgi:hypothetical protein